MDRTRRLLASARLQPADPQREREAIIALLGQLQTLLEAHGVKVEAPPPRHAWWFTFPSDERGVARVAITVALVEGCLMGSLHRGESEASAGRHCNILLARLALEPLDGTLVALDEPQGSALEAVAGGLLRLVGRYPRLAMWGEDPGVSSLLRGVFGPAEGSGGAPRALASLLDRAQTLLAPFPVGLSRPSSNVRSWSFEREPRPGTLWTLVVPEQGVERRVYGHISERQDGHSTGPTRKVVLAELHYDGLSGCLAPPHAEDGSALEALLRGILSALGWTVRPAERA